MLMSGRRYDDHTKERVALLRSQGKSYADIQKEFSIPKSTLSLWLGEKYAGVFDRKAQLEHLKRIRLISAQSKTAARLKRTSIATEKGAIAARNLPLRDTSVLQALLAMLYWAEGSKFYGVSGVRFVNTDPKLIRLYLFLLRSCFPLDESKLRVRLHLHHYHKKKEALRFWSSLTRVPESQFGKLYIKKRNSNKRFRKNFQGICFIYYPGETIREEILGTGQEIHLLLSGRFSASVS